MKRVIMAAALAAALASCSPRNTVVPSDPAHWDQLSGTVKHLSPEDRRLFTAYMARASLSGVFSGGKPNIPQGLTIGQAIDDQRKFEADASAQQVQDTILKAKAAAARAADEAKLNSAATVVLVSKQFVPKNIEAEQFSDRLGMVIAIHNMTAKDISGVKGVMEFDDMFGSTIKNVNLSFDDGVKAGQIHTTSDYYLELNQFDNDDTKLAQTDLSKMKVAFHPQMIVFADGTNLTVPDQTDSTP